MTEFFVVTRVCRADIAEVLGDAALKLTDEEMKRIARRLEDKYIEQLFWESLKIVAEGYVEKHNTE